MAILRRLSDGKGDQGSRMEAIKWHQDGTLENVGYKPMIGYSLLVGSLTARSYSDKDYWLTTEITEILEEKQHDGGMYVKFKTSNSIYELWY